MESEVAAALIGAGGALVGATIGAGAAIRAALPYHKRAALQGRPALIEARFETYRPLLAWMRPYLDEAGSPVDVPYETREGHAQAMRKWYYEEGGVLLLSGDAFNAYRRARETLRKEDATPKQVDVALSALRTELKLDMGSRQLAERNIPYAASDEVRW